MAPANKGLFGQNVLDKVKNLAEAHGDQLAGGLEKVAKVVDDKTKGRYSEKIESGVNAAKKYLVETPKGDQPPPGPSPAP